jgi:hypothetical protein
VTSEEWFENIALVTNSEPTVEEKAKLSMILLKGYIFGDRFMVPAFRSAILEHLEQYLLRPNQTAGSCLAFVEVVKCAYDKVPTGSVVLQLLVDVFCDSWTYGQGSSTNRNAYMGLPLKFLHRTTIRFAEKRDSDKVGQEIKARKANAVTLMRNNYGYTQAGVNLKKETLLEQAFSRPRCYKEHLTEEEKVFCAKGSRHMSYDDFD